MIWSRRSLAGLVALALAGPGSAAARGDWSAPNTCDFPSPTRSSYVENVLQDVAPVVTGVRIVERGDDSTVLVDVLVDGDGLPAEGTLDADRWKIVLLAGVAGREAEGGEVGNCSGRQVFPTLPRGPVQLRVDTGYPAARLRAGAIGIEVMAFLTENGDARLDRAPGNDRVRVDVGPDLRVEGGLVAGGTGGPATAEFVMRNSGTGETGPLRLRFATATSTDAVEDHPSLAPGEETRVAHTYANPEGAVALLVATADGDAPLGESRIALDGGVAASAWTGAELVVQGGVQMIYAGEETFGFRATVANVGSTGSGPVEVRWGPAGTMPGFEVEERVIEVAPGGSTLVRAFLSRPPRLFRQDLNAGIDVCVEAAGHPDGRGCLEADPAALEGKRSPPDFAVLYGAGVSLVPPPATGGRGRLVVDVAFGNNGGPASDVVIEPGKSELLRRVQAAADAGEAIRTAGTLDPIRAGYVPGAGAEAGRLRLEWELLPPEPGRPGLWGATLPALSIPVDARPASGGPARAYLATRPGEVMVPSYAKPEVEVRLLLNDVPAPARYSPVDGEDLRFQVVAFNRGSVPLAPGFRLRGVMGICGTPGPEPCWVDIADERREPLPPGAEARSFLEDHQAACFVVGENPTQLFRAAVEVPGIPFAERPVVDLYLDRPACGGAVE